MAKIQDFCAVSPGMSGCDPGHGAHNRFVGPYEIITILPEKPVKIPQTQEIFQTNGSSFQTNGMDGLCVSAKGCTDICHPVSHIGAGEFHMKAVLGKETDVGRQELHHHHVRGGNQKLF